LQINTGENAIGEARALFVFLLALVPLFYDGWTQSSVDEQTGDD